VQAPVGDAGIPRRAQASIGIDSDAPCTKVPNESRTLDDALAALLQTWAPKTSPKSLRRALLAALASLEDA